MISSRRSSVSPRSRTARLLPSHIFVLGSFFESLVLTIALYVALVLTAFALVSARHFVRPSFHEQIDLPAADCVRARVDHGHPADSPKCHPAVPGFLVSGLTYVFLPWLDV